MWVWYLESPGARGGRKYGGSGSTRVGSGFDVDSSQELVFQLYW
jgi:hypothetical protein